MFAPEDLVVYGGLTLASCGLAWFVHPGAGMMLAGVGLIGTYYGWFVRRRR